MEGVSGTDEGGKKNRACRRQTEHKSEIGKMDGAGGT